MKTTIDAAGRIVVPKAIRDAVHLQAGMSLEVRAVEGRVELEPEPIEVTLERRGGFLVAVPKRRSRRLRGREVDRTLRAVRERSGRP